MRLKIVKDDKSLDLLPTTALQLQLDSPLYFGDRSADLFPGVKAYTITVPATAKNRLLLGRPGQLDNAADFLQEDGWRIYYDDLPILEGRIEVEDGTAQGDINLTFIGGLAGNVSDLKDTFLHLLNYDDDDQDLGETEAEILAAATAITADVAGSPFTFPTIRISGLGDPAEDPITVPPGDPAGDPRTYKHLNLYVDDTFVKSGEIGGLQCHGTLSPQLRVKYILEQALKSVGYSLNGIFSSHELADELGDLLLFNVNTLDVQPEQNEEELTFDDLQLGGSFKLKNFLPQVTAAKLLRELCNIFCLAPILDTAQRRLILQDHAPLIDAAPAADWSKKVDPIYRRSRALEDIPQAFQYSHTTDDDYAAERAKQWPGVAIDHSFENYQEAEDVLTLDDLGTLKYIYIRSLNEFFTSSIYWRAGQKNLGLTRRGKDLGLVNENKTPLFTPGADTLHMITKNENPGRNYVLNGLGPEFVPVYYGEVITPLQSGKQLKNIIFLIYRGLQERKDGHLYPLASSSRYRWDESAIGELSLLWEGTDELYGRWWEKWIEALRLMRPVNYATRLSATDLAALDWRKVVRIDKHRYFIKRIQVTLRTDRILPASVEYMQIN
jgi:hypothetical protein